MKEIWKNIPDYEGHYIVSNLGNVKSIKFNKEITLKQANDAYGYKHLTLFKNGIMKTIKVHKLVAMCFLGHKPSGYSAVINHINHNRKDNRVCNLEEISQRENANLKHIKSSSKYVGVGFDKYHNRYASYIKINKKKIHLGYFKCEIKAGIYYNLALQNIKSYYNDPKLFRNLIEQKFESKTNEIKTLIKTKLKDYENK